MENMKFGYARVSTDAQSLDRQIDALNKYGVDELLTEKMTGTKRSRPELDRLIDKMPVQFGAASFRACHFLLEDFINTVFVQSV